MIALILVINGICLYSILSVHLKTYKLTLILLDMIIKTFKAIVQSVYVLCVVVQTAIELISNYGLWFSVFFFLLFFYQWTNNNNKNIKRTHTQKYTCTDKWCIGRTHLLWFFVFDYYTSISKLFATALSFTLHRFFMIILRNIICKQIVDFFFILIYSWYDIPAESQNRWFHSIAIELK